MLCPNTQKMVSQVQREQGGLNMRRGMGDSNWERSWGEPWRAFALGKELLQLEGTVRVKSRDGRCQSPHAQKSAIPSAVTGPAVEEEIPEDLETGGTSRIQHSSLECGSTVKVWLEGVGVSSSREQMSQGDGPVLFLTC